MAIDNTLLLGLQVNAKLRKYMAVDKWWYELALLVKAVSCC